MSKSTLKQRVALLEKKVSELETAVANCEPKKDWRSTLGMFSSDDVAKRVDAAILEAREKERRKARRGLAKADS